MTPLRVAVLAVAVVVGALLLFRPPSEADRADELVGRLRCPECQAESIADSPASRAREMQALVEEQVEQGKSDAEVLALVRAHYGDWVLSDPPASRSTLLMWVLPIAVLAVGIAAVLAYRSRENSNLPSDPDLLAEPSETETSPGLTRRRTLVGSAVMLVACVGIALAVARSTQSQPDGRTVTDDQPAAAPRDLSQVTNEELEGVIRANPTVVPMRLALVERYLRAGELAKAREHARTALDQKPGPADKQRALKYLGWATASLGDPAAGVKMLEESLAMAPDDIDAKWFLAQVRLEALGDRPGAVALFESILADEALPPDKRAIVEARLSEARESA